MNIFKRFRETKRIAEENILLKKQLEGSKNWCDELSAEKQAAVSSLFKLYQLVEEVQDITVLRDSADRVMKHYMENGGVSYRPDYIPLWPVD